MSKQTMTAVVAVGGNSLISDRQHQDVASQQVAVQETCKHIVDMIENGWNPVITHGNGPQVGFILRRNELAAGQVHTTPLDLIGADTQGAIGYLIAQAISNEFTRRGIRRSIAAVVTQVLVDRNDPAFEHPTKGIGGFTSEQEARAFEREGWQVMEDAGRGWRRVIASPMPQQIIELDAVRGLLRAGIVTIAVGGGGIPVIRSVDGALQGVAAVIDKDYASSLLARSIGADLFLISTAVERVYLDFNRPTQRALDRMTLAEARQYVADGQFAAGSMLPKIQAIIWFLEAGGKEALITNPQNLLRALRGETGTRIVS